MQPVKARSEEDSTSKDKIKRRSSKVRSEDDSASEGKIRRRSN